MNTKKKRSVLCLILAALMLFSLSGCGQEGGGSGKEEKPEEVLLPISVNGKEIKVGETNLQVLLDEGLDVSWVDESFNRITIDPDTELEANSYYTGGACSSIEKKAHICLLPWQICALFYAQPWHKMNAERALLCVPGPYFRLFHFFLSKLSSGQGKERGKYRDCAWQERHQRKCGVR